MAAGIHSRRRAVMARQDSRASPRNAAKWLIRKVSKVIKKRAIRPIASIGDDMQRVELPLKLDQVRDDRHMPELASRFGHAGELQPRHALASPDPLDLERDELRCLRARVEREELPRGPLQQRSLLVREQRHRRLRGAPHGFEDLLLGSTPAVVVVDRDADEEGPVRVLRPYDACRLVRNGAKGTKERRRVIILGSGDTGKLGDDGS